jgi:lipid-A-disaccharide synthase
MQAKLDNQHRDSSTPLIAMVAGETSGDQLGSALMKALRLRYPAARFVGIGGPGMKDQGLEAWWDSDELAVMGLAEVVSHLPRLLRLRKALKDRLLQAGPDMLIGIDAPDFNLGLETQLRKKGITTVHYVSPTVWAWRQGRVRKIARAADLVMCLFPFEPDFYDSHGVSAKYTGHPMADEIPDQHDRREARIQLGLDPDAPCIAILPGSRRGEVERLSRHLLGAAELLQERDPSTQFIAPMAGAEVDSLFSAIADSFPGLKCRTLDGQARLAMAASDLVICASGTATLETMLVNRPMVAVYRFSTLTYAIGKSLKLLKSRFFSLPNILAGQPLVPELEQHQVNARRIAAESIAWLDDPGRCETVREQFANMHAELRRNAAESAADCIQSLLDRKP